jgi:predicted adenylyl cyclase CyaB
MSTYEIEIKTLLGDKEKADSLRRKINSKGGVLLKQNKQLNHYFTVSDIKLFKDKVGSYVKDTEKPLFNEILTKGKDFSIRTRDADGKVLIVVKASIGGDTSSNGVSRMEFESDMDMSIEDLDNLLLESGLKYQAKWSRDREEYKMGDINVCLDKNAGYGYLAEFEKMSDDESLTGTIKKELLELMKEFEVEELSQDRLERMFKYYNQNWEDYYGTDKIFNIE